MVIIEVLMGSISVACFAIQKFIFWHLFVFRNPAPNKTIMFHLLVSSDRVKNN